MNGYRARRSSSRNTTKSSNVVRSGEKVLDSMAMPPMPTRYPSGTHLVPVVACFDHLVGEPCFLRREGQQVAHQRFRRRRQDLAITGLNPLREIVQYTRVAATMPAFGNRNRHG